MKSLALLDEFKNWMERNGYKTTVSASYASYLRTLLTKLYTGGYTVIPNPEELFNNVMGYSSLVKGLLEYFYDAIKKAYADNHCPISQKQLNNGRSAFRKFVEFILWHLSQVTTNLPVVSQMAIKQTAIYTKPVKVYQNMMGWKTYNQNDIVRIMKSRLGTQDRLSGDKVWLPIRVVKELLGSEWFDDWCKIIISKTKVLIDDHGRFVMLNQVDELILKPDSDDKYGVWIVVGGQEHRVYTHTKSGILKPLMAKDMGDISLEHTHPIDETLKDLGGRHCLPELSKISDIIKQVSAAINSKDAAMLKKHIKVDGIEVKSGNPLASTLIDLDELHKEMDLIRDDTGYELMDIKQNIGGRGRTGTRIGQYARQTLTDLLQSNKLTPDDISNLEDPAFCRNTLGMNYPVLVDVRKNTPEKGRYYKPDRSIEPYVICNDWYERNRARFDAWLTTI